MSGEVRPTVFGMDNPHDALGSFGDRLATFMAFAKTTSNSGTPPEEPEVLIGRGLSELWQDFLALDRFVCAYFERQAGSSRRPTTTTTEPAR